MSRSRSFSRGNGGVCVCVCVGVFAGVRVRVRMLVAVAYGCRSRLPLEGIAATGNRLAAMFYVMFPHSSFGCTFYETRRSAFCGLNAPITSAIYLKLVQWVLKVTCRCPYWTVHTRTLTSM